MTMCHQTFDVLEGNTLYTQEMSRSAKICPQIRTEYLLCNYHREVLKKSSLIIIYRPLITVHDCVQV